MTMISKLSWSRVCAATASRSEASLAGRFRVASATETSGADPGTGTYSARLGRAVPDRKPTPRPAVRPTCVGACRPRATSSAAGHRGQDRHLVAVVDLGLEAAEETDVLAPDVY